MKQTRRILAAWLAILMLVTAMPLGFAEELEMIELSPEEIAQLIAEPEADTSASAKDEAAAEFDEDLVSLEVEELYVEEDILVPEDNIPEESPADESEDEILLDMTIDPQLSGEFTIADGVLKSYNGSDEEVVIPDGVTSIARLAFYGNKSIRTLVIPASVTSIADSRLGYAEGAFQGCSNLEKVVFAEGSALTFIGRSAFEDCTRLSEIILPAGLEKIGARAFENCDMLNSVEIPEGVSWIGEYAYSDCNDLESVILPGTLAETGDGIFCGSDLKEVTIPGSLKVIQRISFLNCKSLRKLIIEAGVEGIEGSRLGYAEGAFQGCSELRTVEIRGESFKYIGRSAFEDCVRLNSVILPENMDNIGPRAFAECSKLESINLPAGITYIGEYAFLSTGSLKHVQLPAALAETDDGIFCASGLEEITIPGSLKVIQRISFLNCKSLKKVSIESGVESIEGSRLGYAEGAFEGCSALETVEIQGDDFEYIGRSAFEDCTSLVNVSLPEGMLSIGPRAFAECFALPSIVIPEGVDWIDEYAFYNCIALKSARLPGTLKNTAAAIFYGSGLEEITIPGSLETIRKMSFMNCKNLKKVVIEDGVEAIEGSGYYVAEGAFQDCTALEALEINSDDFLTIGTKAFTGCKNLKSVSLPEDLEKINAFAFQNCAALETLYLPESVEEFGNDVFKGCTNATIWVYENTASHGYCRDCSTAQGFKFKLIGSEPVLAFKGDAQPVHFEKEGGSVSLEIISNQDWMVSAPEWVQLSAEGGSGNGGFSITVVTNNGAAREGSIVVSSEECANLVLPVSQASGCEHTSGLYVYEEIDDEAYVSNGADSHVHSYIVVSRELCCFECGESLQKIELGDKVSQIEEHCWNNYDTGADNKLVCDDCGAEKTVKYPCKHKVLGMREDGNLECYKCGKTVILNAKGNCSHSDFTIFEDGVAATRYDIIDKNRHLKTASFHKYDDTYGAYRDAVCNSCGENLIALNGKIDQIGVTDCAAVDFDNSTFVETHEFHEGACACGYVIPKIEFTGYEDGDAVEINTDITLAWKCDGYNDFAVHAKLLSGQPNPESDNEAGEEIAFTRSGNTVSFTAPDAAGRIIKLHVQGVEKDGSLSRSENQIYLKLVDKNQISLIGTSLLVVGKSATLKAYNLEGKSLSAKSVKWTTSNKSIVTVSNGKITAKKVGAATITATAKDGTYGLIEITVCPKAKTVTITIDGEKAASTAAIDLGSDQLTLQLDAVIDPENAKQEVSWKSSSTKIATVRADGLVTAKKAGTATITATAKDGSKKVDTIKISVGIKAKEISISGKTELSASKTTTLKAVVSPSNATNKGVTWSSSNKNVATISSSGKVTAKKVKTRQSVIITAKAKDGSGIIAEHELFICPAATGVQILVNGAAAKSAKAYLGSTLQLAAKVLPDDAAQAVSWKSSSTKIAKVNSNGLVTPMKKGSATITATAANGKKAACKITVEKAPPIVENSEFSYTIANNEVTITGYIGSNLQIVVPDTIDGYPVRHIGEHAFESCRALKSINIPDGVVSIGKSAFHDCAEDLTIYGISGSAAEEYANANSIRFEAINAPIEPELPSEVNITGGFGAESMELQLGAVQPLNGMVKITGGTLGYVTLDIVETNKKYASIELTGAENLSLETFEEFILDTSKEPFNVPGTYTVNLWARAEGSAPDAGVKLDSISVTVKGLQGSFDQENLTLWEGKTQQISGRVVSGGMNIAKVTVNVLNWGTTIHTRDFTADKLNIVNLQDYSGYTLDPAMEPFTTPGNYTLQLWASGDDGTSGTLLDEMTVTVPDNTLQKPTLSVKIDYKTFTEEVHKDTKLYRRPGETLAFWVQTTYSAGIDKLSYYLMTGGGVPVPYMNHDKIISTEGYIFGADKLDPNGGYINPGMYIPANLEKGLYYITIIAENAAGATEMKIEVHVTSHTGGPANDWQNTGDILTDLIAVARTQIGYKEIPNEIQKYGYDIVGNTGGYKQWCAYFTAWCARQAGIETTVIRSSGAAKAESLCPNAAEIAHFYTNTDIENKVTAARKANPKEFSQERVAEVAGSQNFLLKNNAKYYANRSDFTPKAGDLIFFHKRNWEYAWGHVGIVTGCSGNIVYFIDGNNNGNGSPRDGTTNVEGMVYERQETYTNTASNVIAFARLLAD